MPGHKAHINFGFILFLISIYILLTRSLLNLSFLTAILCAFACILGSVFPDIDITSKIQKMFFLVSTLVIIFSLITSNIVVFVSFALFCVFLLLLKHRTLTHNILFIAGLSFLPSAYVNCACKSSSIIHNTKLIALFFFIGTASHIFLDFFVSRVLKK